MGWSTAPVSDMPVTWAIVSLITKTEPVYLENGLDGSLGAKKVSRRFFSFYFYALNRMYFAVHPSACDRDQMKYVNILVR